MWLRKSLKIIDIYGTKFGFKLENQETFNTAFGGTLTIMTFTIVVILSFFLGQDFYHRTNPSIYIDTIVPEKYDPPVTLAPENFTIAWRIEGETSENKNFTDIIYPVIRQFSYKRNETTNEMQKLNDVKILQTTKCSQENTQSETFIKNYKLDDWYCFDWTNRDFSFGGFWDGDYLNYFLIGFYMCKAGMDYNEKNPNCTKVEDYERYQNKNGRMIVSFLYPEYYFHAIDVENPLRISYKNYFYYLNTKSKKLDRMFFNQISLIDDKGWMFDDIENSSILSFNKIQSDQNPNYISDGSGSLLYSAMFYMQKNSISIRRSYRKIQDVAAQIGGLMKLLMTLFSLLNQLYSNFKFQICVLNQIFEFPEDSLNTSSTVVISNNK